MRLERWIRENLEAVAIAIVMALVIRQFAVEAFMIPTGSMTPTLYGRENGKRPGDRILVDKIGPLASGLSRWDVIVFKYPLNESRNYIKRLIGLGGETVTIRDGDIWIDGRIARKPEDVQEVLSYRLHPRPPGPPGAPPEEPWLLDGPIRRDGTALAAEGEAVAMFAETVQDARYWSPSKLHGRHTVGDRELRLRVTPTGAGGTVFLRLVENRTPLELVLAVGSGESRLCRGEETLPLEGVVLSPGEETEIRFSNYDNALQARIGGKRFLYEHGPDERIDHSGDSVAFGVRGARARFDGMEIRRDIHYVAEGNHEDVEVDEDGLYVLGDNSRSSRDSRRWRRRVYEMSDGNVYAKDTNYDPEAEPPFEAEPGEVVFQDVKGVWRRIEASEIRVDRVEDASLVPRANVVGKAFFIFWPLNPTVPDRFRLGFIR
jgi:signal peptidase I